MSNRSHRPAPDLQSETVDWLAEYGVEAREFDRPADLGVPATLTVIRRSLRTDERSYCVLPVDPAPAGDARRQAIVDCIQGYFPELRPRRYDADKDVATFVGRKHVYTVIYEEHEPDAPRVSDAA